MSVDYYTTGDGGELCVGCAREQFPPKSEADDDGEGVSTETFNGWGGPVLSWQEGSTDRDTVCDGCGGVIRELPARDIHDEDTAREVASDWHGGQASALYSFSSSGHISSDLLVEISGDLAKGRGFWSASERSWTELERLADWVESRLEQRGLLHDPECTGCEHDCPHAASTTMGAPWCSICDDHYERGA